MHLFKTAVAASVLSLALATAAFGAPATYTSEPNHTFVRFSYNHLGFSTQESRFNNVKATVTYDPAAKTGSVEVLTSIPNRSIPARICSMGTFRGSDYPRYRAIRHRHLQVHVGQVRR